MTIINGIAMRKCTDEKIVQLIIEKVKSKITDYYPDFKKVKIFLKLKYSEIRDWSIIFCIDILDNNNNIVKTIYVKIPKQARKIQSVYSVLGNKEVHERAYGEYITLKRLTTSYSDSSTLLVIRPLDFLDDLNAVVLEGFSGKNIYLLLQSNFKKLTKIQLQNLLYYCGKWLAKVHKDWKIVSRGDIAKEKFCQTLKHYRYPINQMPKIYRKMNMVIEAYANRYKNDFNYSKMLDGFEIRNILIGDQGAGIIDLYEKEGFPYDDVARFIISIKIIYWGTLWFIFKRQPDSLFIESFLNGYCSILSIPHPFIHLFLLKEILRQYSNAYLSLSDKKLASYIKRVIGKVYIDRFYQSEIKKIIRIMEHQ